MTAGIKANADGSAAIQVGGSDAITITSGLNTTFAGTASVATGALYPLVSGTAVASTSGTSIDFTGIPSTAKRITVMLQGVSTNGTSVLRVQLGTSSGITTSGYLGAATTMVNVVATTNFTAGFDENASGGSTATSIRHAAYSIQTLGSNNWICTALMGFSNDVRSNTISGSVALAGTLDRIRITTANGTDTFDAGSINILWE